MGTNQDTGLPTGEGTPPSEQVSSGPQLVQPTPEYVSRDEVLRLLDDVRREAATQGQRGAQSFIDKARLNERVSSTEKMLKRLVSEGTLDEAQASTHLATARLEALTDMLPEQESPQQRQAGSRDPYAAAAAQALAASGIVPGDPEYTVVTRNDYASPFAWYDALNQQKAAKLARLARAQAAVAAQTVTPTMPATLPPNPGAAVEAGGTGAAPVSDLKTLRSMLSRAYERSDYKERDRISAEIDRLTLPQR